MSTTSAVRTSSAPPHGTPPRRPRRWIWWVIGGVVVAVVVILLLLTIASAANNAHPTSSAPLDPADHGEAGTSALASILTGHGVDVATVRGLDALRATERPGADTTVVISGAASMSAPVAGVVGDRIRDAHRVVAIDPSQSALSVLAPGITVSYNNTPTPTSTAECAVPGVSPGDVVSADPSLRLLRETDVDPSTTGCFGRGHDGGYDMVISAPTPAGPPVVAMTGTMTLNKNLGRYDNAGVSVRTIATSDHVLWYVPLPGDRIDEPASHQGTEQSVFPRAVGPMFLLAFFAVLALVVWRGRRVGPLSTEPLPAVVKAIETTQSRGRMYRRAAADRAAAVLRVRTIARLAAYLGVPYDPGRALAALDDGHPSTPDPVLATVISAIATATGRDRTALMALLDGPLPRTDDDLVRFTDALTTLDKEVRRAP
ncbi:DUF4350 domain-containing protein [Gordonia sp. DT219]|uniref:DUF4350 domain-containing protein n=1 Tax=Gordonia sp. DT219 TaxID=3416658 RepID=UPI003CF539EA